jgi:hypothetical protein
MWLTKLKIAIIEKNTDALSILMDDIPKLSSSEDIEQVIYLLKEATALVTTLKDETSASMKQMKANLNFLHSTQAPARNMLDIKS